MSSGGSSGKVHRGLSASTLHLLSLAYCTAVSVNLLSCVWLHIGLGQIARDGADGAVTWLSAVGPDDLQAAPLWRQFVAAYYFTVTTITTVGYGDVTAKNSGEEVGGFLLCVCLCLCLCVCLLFHVCISFFVCVRE